MKYILAVCILLGFSWAKGQTLDEGQNHKIVIQFVASDSLSQYSLIGNIKNIKEIWPKAQIEVVLHSGGILLAVKDKTKYAAELYNYFEKQAVKIAVCQNTMKARKITKDQLLSFVETVPSGVTEIILKQENGWSYLKGGL